MTGYSVCIIGNSHVNAISQAWANRNPRVSDGVSLTFFAAATNQLQHLTLYRRMLATRDQELRDRFLDSAGEQRIEIERFDAFVLVGMTFGIDVLKLCETMGILERAQPGRAEQAISRACLAAVIRGSFETSLALDVARMIRTVSKAPVLILAAPFRPEHCLEDPEYRDQPCLRDPDLLEGIVRQAKAAAAPAVKAVRCEALWQPESTVSLPGFTKYSLSRHSTAGGRKVIEQDRRHGNEEFGEIVLAAILRRLDELSHGRVLPAELERAASG